MLIQSLSIISGLLFLTGIILATNFTVAKNIANQQLGFALQIASSRALNDAQTWARDSLALSNQENQPMVLQQGEGSSQFGCVDTNCSLLFRDRWIITGTSVNANQSSAGSIARNLEPALGEGRVSMTVTTNLYKTLTDTSRMLATRSFTFTGRYLNAPPYFVSTAANDINANLSAKDVGEGDSGGTRKIEEGNYQAANGPEAAVPAGYVDTVLQTQITCINSKDAQSKNPYLDVPSSSDSPKIPKHSYVPNDETMVWIYEAPCEAPFGAIVGLPTGVNIRSSGEFDHAGESSLFWTKGDSVSSNLGN